MRRWQFKNSHLMPLLKRYLGVLTVLGYLAAAASLSFSSLSLEMGHYEGT